MIFNFLLQVNPVPAEPVVNEPVVANTAIESVNFFQLIMKGGVMVIPIFILFFLTVYIIVERYLYIKKQTKLDNSLINELKYQLNSGNIQSAAMICDKSNTAYGTVLRNGVNTIGRPINEIDLALEKSANIEMGLMEKKLGYLGIVAGIAPILGFIGTISGVIKIFYTISITENISIGNISGGLYEKMISSGLGLIVGVIAYAAYHFFNMMIDHFALNVQRQGLEFINVIQQPNTK